MEKKEPRNLGETMRDEMYLKDNIINLLREGARTIPEIAAELDIPSQEVMMYVMAMRRYGKIEELPKSRMDDYYQYQLKQEKG
ncbi:MAG: hypothetical protein A2161_15120 [Candidatus Schekmanbacteria bacterium RBG_13_48_7]|uniref:Uncharacterized protein n=1 Tax=Candidatus Schekmanbacteria bacterium RBG_13_48_7 TaxID=1817878 RepID=A0A1F7RW91_9BACT|nr:MAG: hypothetical protein A2161_15120 [Candidatus Schekmanbacteria bacterium RBG_13_48_7]